MTEKQWKSFAPFFTPEECGKGMDYGFMLLLKAFRIIFDSPMHIISGWDTSGHSDTSFHYKGRAVDWWSVVSPRKTLRLLDRTGMFNGVGFYLWGKHKSWHIDNRPSCRYQRWLSPEKGKYLYLIS